MANLIVGNDGSNTLPGTTGTDVIYGYDPNGPQSQASSILATRVAAMEIASLCDPSGS